MDIMRKQFHEKKLKARLAFTVPKMIEIRMHAQVSPPFLFLWSCGASIIEYKTHKMLHIHPLASPAPRDRVRGLLG